MSRSAPVGVVKPFQQPFVILGKRSRIRRRGRTVQHLLKPCLPSVGVCRRLEYRFTAHGSTAALQSFLGSQLLERLVDRDFGQEMPQTICLPSAVKKSSHQ